MEIPGCFMRALGFLSSPVAPNESITTKLIQGTFSFQPIKMTHFFPPSLNWKTTFARPCCRLPAHGASTYFWFLMNARSF